MIDELIRQLPTNIVKVEWRWKSINNDTVFWPNDWHFWTLTQTTQNSKNISKTIVHSSSKQTPVSHKCTSKWPRARYACTDYLWAKARERYVRPCYLETYNLMDLGPVLWEFDIFNFLVGCCWVRPLLFKSCYLCAYRKYRSLLFFGGVHHYNLFLIL